MPFPVSRAAPSGNVQNAAAPSGAHLSYYGGRVLSQVRVVEVIYGPGTYVAQTTASAAPSVSSFFGGVTNSPYFDWLTEYNTTTTAVGGQPGTNQIIGRGSFAGSFTISPSAANNGSTIQDSNIRAELSAQITGAHLPAPDANTLYSIFFRNGQSICSGTSCSLVAGGFCAYHSTIAAAGRLPELYYSVEPDLGGPAGSGCGGGTAFQNTTSVASHEMIEAVTDAEVGLAPTYAPPMAWNDPTNGEIGDICSAQQGSIVGGDGIAYTVQKQFSNLANNCIVTRVPTYSDVIASDHPIDYWRLNDATSTAHDTVGAFDGTYVSTYPSPTLPPLVAGATPKDTANQGKLFNTSMAGSVGGAPSAGIVGDSTVEAWFQIPANAGTDSTNGMFASSTSGAGTWGAVEWYGATGSRCLEYAGGRAFINVCLQYPGTAASQVWHHFALTLSGSTATIYIDAKVAGVGSAAASTQPSGPAYVGADGYNGSGGFNGALQDVAVYDKALTASQIAAHIAAAI